MMFGAKTICDGCREERIFARETEEYGKYPDGEHWFVSHLGRKRKRSEEEGGKEETGTNREDDHAQSVVELVTEVSPENSTNTIE